MSENYEMIAAANLPTTDAKEVDVICVEGGELKRKPGASLGGNAGGYVVKVPADIDVSGEMNMIADVNYDEFAELLYNGGTLWFDFSEVEAMTSTMPLTPLRVSAPIWGYYPEMGVMAIVSLGDLAISFIFTNGTWTPPIE